MDLRSVGNKHFVLRFLPAVRILVFISLLMNFPLSGQDDIPLRRRDLRHGVSLGYGRQSLATRDMAASPMTYSGSLDQVHFSYFYNGVKNRHLIAASAGRGTLQASTKNLLRLDHVDIRYHYYRHVSSLLNQRFCIFAGLGINHVSSEKQFDIARDFMNIGSFDESTSLNLSIMGEFRLAEKDKASFGLNLPAMAYVLRPNYSLFPRDVISRYDTPLEYFFGEGKILTVNGFSGLNAWISCEKGLFSSLSARLAYSFSYYRINRPAETALAANSLSINLVYLF